MWSAVFTVEVSIGFANAMPSVLDTFVQRAFSVGRSFFVFLLVFALQDCDCEDYCSKCSAVFTLDVSWEKKSRGRPEHMQDQPVHVTSADLVGSVSLLWFQYNLPWISHPY